MPGWRRRLWIYPLLLAAGAGWALVRRPPAPSPRADLAAMLREVRSSGGRELAFREGEGYLHVFPRRGYVLVLNVASIAALSPASHLTLDRRDDALRVGLILPSGGERLLGPQASSTALASAEVSVEKLEATLAEVYGDPEGPPPDGPPPPPAKAAPPPGKG
ncbi:MAG: hypothetical protein AB7N76_12250 [Planctomycetota bacterium]